MRCHTIALVVALVAACGPTVGGSGGSGGEEVSSTTLAEGSDATSASSTNAPAGSDTNSADGTTGVPVVCELGGCPITQDFCSPGCGAAPSPFDADGCLRARCTDDASCADDERCFRGEDFGLCESSGMTCGEDDAGTACHCTRTTDCGGGHCIPADDFPRIGAPPVGRVVAANLICSDWVLRITTNEVEDACNDPTQDASADVRFRGGVGGTVHDPEAVDDFWRDEDGTHPIVAAGLRWADEVITYWVIYGRDDGPVWVAGTVDEQVICPGVLVPCG